MSTSQLRSRVVSWQDGIDVPREFVEQPGSAIAPVSEPPQALWRQISQMTVVQRVKLALRGNRNARMILR